MNGLALCAGIGGLELGLRLALGDTYRTVGYVERDSYAASTLVARMEDEALDWAPVADDLESFDGTVWRGCVDLVAAGFPCQPWSQAGKREGTDDDRWLWPAIWRIVRDVQPRWVFLENVPGLVRGGLGAVLADLSRGGFAAEWDVFSAQGVGAPHLRRRVFILAERVSDAERSELRQEQGRREPRGTGATEPGDVVEDVADSASRGRGERGEPPGRGGQPDGTGPSGDSTDLADAVRTERGPDHEHDELPGGRQQAASVSRGVGSLFPPGPSDFDMWARVLAETPEVEPSLCGVADGVPDRLLDRSDRLRCLGNAVVPSCAAVAFTVLARRI